jgi:xanthine dehydrogenase accessory factor
VDIYRRVFELLANGQTFCLATVIATQIPEMPLGKKTVVHGEGVLEGEFVRPDLERVLIAEGLNCLETGLSRSIEIYPETRVFIDILSGQAKLLICGAGHIAVSLARIAREVGFRVTVLDDRPEYAHPSRFPDCQVIVQDFRAALAKMLIDSSTYIVVITRGHEHDTECLLEILPRETAYLGLIGSRRRIRFVMEMLVREGISSSRLKDIFAPIGLPLGAESPQEIALSIAAELMCVHKLGAGQTKALRLSGSTDWSVEFHE